MIPYLRMVNLQKTIRYPTGHTYIANNYMYGSNYPLPPRATRPSKSSKLSSDLKIYTNYRP